MDCMGICWNNENGVPTQAYVDNCGCCVGGSTVDTSACMPTIGDNSGELYIPLEYSDFNPSIHLDGSSHLIGNWGMDDCGSCFPDSLQNNTEFTVSNCVLDSGSPTGGYCTDADGYTTEISCHYGEEWTQYGGDCININEEMQSSCSHEAGVSIGVPVVWDCEGIDNGVAFRSICGFCVGGTTGRPINYLEDCLGNCPSG
jgi:hypothetical protein